MSPGSERDGQVAVVLVHDDPPGDVQPQPGALADRLGGEERLEDPRDDVGRDARAGVADLDLRRVVASPGPEGERAVAAHRLQRVVDQVRPHLVQLRAVHRNVGQHSVVVAHDLDLVADLAAQHHQGALQQLVDVEDLMWRAVHLRVLLGRRRPGWRCGWPSPRSRSSAARSRGCSSASAARLRACRRRRSPRPGSSQSTSMPACTKVAAISNAVPMPCRSNQSTTSSSRSATSIGVSSGAFATCSTARSCRPIKVSSALRSQAPPAMTASLCRMPATRSRSEDARADRGRGGIVQLVGQAGRQRPEREQSFPLGNRCSACAADRGTAPRAGAAPSGTTAASVW